MEILPLGPVVIIDTPGLDDEGSLGALRVEKTREVLAKTDLAILVTEAGRPMLPAEQALLSLFREKKLPHLLAYNKADLTENRPALPENALYVSALTGENVDALKNLLGTLAGKTKSDKKILADLLSPGDRVVLVIPVDAAAPKGRLSCLSAGDAGASGYPLQLLSLSAGGASRVAFLIYRKAFACDHRLPSLQAGSGGHAGGDSPYLLLDSFCEIQRRAGDPRPWRPSAGKAPGGR